MTLFLAARNLNRAALLSSILVLAWLAPCAWAQSEIDEVYIQPRIQAPIATPTVAALAALDSGSKPMKVNVDLVLVPITIMDGMNRLVKGLDRNSFGVYEGKSPQEIRYFSESLAYHL